MRVLPSPLDNELQQLTASAKKELIVVSPWLKLDALQRLKFDPTLSCAFLIKGDLEDFLSGSSDLDAVRNLFDLGVQVRLVTNLHAKLYLADRQRAIVTSSNLTLRGMKQNIEMGVLLEDKIEVERLAVAVEGWLATGRLVDRQWLNQMRLLVKKRHHLADKLRRSRHELAGKKMRTRSTRVDTTIVEHLPAMGIEAASKEIVIPESASAEQLEQGNDPTQSFAPAEGSSLLSVPIAPEAPYEQSILHGFSVPSRQQTIWAADESQPERSYLRVPYRDISPLGSWANQILTWNIFTKSNPAQARAFVRLFKLAFDWLPEQALTQSWFCRDPERLQLLLYGIPLVGINVYRTTEAEGRAIMLMSTDAWQRFYGLSRRPTLNAIANLPLEQAQYEWEWHTLRSEHWLHVLHGETGYWAAYASGVQKLLKERPLASNEPLSVEADKVWLPRLLGLAESEQLSLF